MLSTNQLQAIDYHLREVNRLANEELILELTDHYTVALTEFMGQGMTFETALTEVQKTFGGRKGLQKMERQYNRVTFVHYDQRWQRALAAQFHKPLVWHQTVPGYLILLTISFLSYAPELKFDGDSYNGFIIGTLSGFIILLAGTVWSYVKALFRHGIHNVPTEILYLLKRHGVILPMLYGIGVVGYYWILPALPYPCQPILLSLYLSLFGLYMRTGNLMYESLYETYSTR